MSETNFIYKEKTEKYKEDVIELEDPCSNEIITEENVILIYDGKEINLHFTFNLFYLYDYYTMLQYYNFVIDCEEHLKKSVQKFIETTYFDKDVFDQFMEDP